MRLGRTAESIIERFFREEIRDESFEVAAVRFYSGRLIDLVLRLVAVEGITFGQRIFLAEHCVGRDETGRCRIDEELTIHEIVHCRQYRRDGALRFLTRYLTDYWRNVRQTGKLSRRVHFYAYLNIPYEIEAREIASKFVIWRRAQID